MSPEFGIGYTDKGSVVLLPTFNASPLGQVRLVDRAVYLWLAQQANHLPFTKQLDGKTIAVDRGEWFGSRVSLAAALGLHKRTLARALDALSIVGAVTVQSVKRRQRYKKSPVDGAENTPLNGAESAPEGGGNCTDVRCLGTLVKVLGWKDFVVQRGNGAKNAPQVSTTEPAGRVPRLTSRQRAENERSMALVRAGGI